jgi:hypothetical protein
VREPTLILLVHLCKIRHIIQEHTTPNHLLNTGTSLLENGLEVENALLGLFGDASGVQGAGGVSGDLTGDEEETGAGDTDGLGVGACCWEGVSGALNNGITLAQMV